MSPAKDRLIWVILAAAVYLTMTYNPDGLVDSEPVIDALGRYAEDVLDAIEDGQRVGT